MVNLASEHAPTSSDRNSAIATFAGSASDEWNS